MSIMTSWLF